ncbi:hypothetical protein [Leptospira noguchii]|nr:hypothetical protein [Leptospira noguchii]
MTDKKSIPRKIQKLAYQEVGLKCTICSEDDITTLGIHHIDSQEWVVDMI